ncbi:MAG: hypothetical protein L3K23_06425 [Thermoplasmata archaeon]|nr:hypothetical protein [Thermoplasmata archaeon]
MTTRKSGHRLKADLRRTLRFPAIGSAGGVIGLAMLMLVAPVAAGGIVHGPVKLLPPFHASVSTGNFVYSSGCAKAKTPTDPQFSDSTGVAKAREWAWAKTSCAAGSGYGSIYNYLTITWPIAIGTTGAHSIKVNAAYSFNTSVDISYSGKCPTTTSTTSYGTFTSGSCAAYAATGFDGPFYLMDTTNGSAFASPQNLPPFALTAENSVSIYYGCYNPSYGGICFSYNSSTYSLLNSYSVPTTGKIPAVFWFNASLNASDSYELVWYGTTDTYAQAYGWPSATAMAHLDFETGPNGVFFHSIVIH